MADQSPYDKNLRIVINQHMASETVAMELVVRYGLKATLATAHDVIDRHKKAKKKYSIKNAYEVIEQCEIMYPIYKFSRKIHLD